MFSFAPAIVENSDYHHLDADHDFYSVEFGLNGSHPVYQFKLRHSQHAPHFFLIKDSSRLAAELKVGDIMPMKYYCNDPVGSVRNHKTRIEAIVSETEGRFKGHYQIELSILENTVSDAQSPIESEFN